MGVLQIQFLPGLSTFDENSHQNGSKNGETAPRPGTGYPHEGPSVEPLGSHLRPLIIYKLGFNQDYCTFALILQVQIVLCSEFN